jgi:hypothetical protein
MVTLRSQSDTLRNTVIMAWGRRSGGILDDT